MEPPSPDTLKRELGLRIADLARAVLPDGHLEGAEWIGHGPDGAKWGIVLKGRKAGYFQNFGTGHGGTSALALVRDAVCGGDYRHAYVWALRFLGNDVLVPARMRAPPAQEPPRKGGNGQALYLQAWQFSWENPVGQYLIGRGIEPARVAWPLRALRYHPTCWNSEAGENLPAMVAAIVNPMTGEHVATHRTWLAKDHRLGWIKAPLGQPKKSVGHVKGGVIALTRGHYTRALPRPGPREGCVIAEGIENALVGAMLFPEWRALAAVSVGNLPAIELPGKIRSVTLMKDRDGENVAVMETREAAYARWDLEGRKVEVWEPPEGCHDAADYWRQVQAGERDG